MAHHILLQQTKTLNPTNGSHTYKRVLRCVEQATLTKRKLCNNYLNRVERKTCTTDSNCATWSDWTAWIDVRNMFKILDTFESLTLIIMVTNIFKLVLKMWSRCPLECTLAKPTLICCNSIYFEYM